jgi:hypothetical protein
MINDFDILCLVETKTDDCDIINIPGYKWSVSILTLSTLSVQAFKHKQQVFK